MPPANPNSYRPTAHLARSGRLGADGMAFWYTKEKDEMGPIYGSKDKWDGLAVIFDTYDNDGRVCNASLVGFIAP